MLEPFAEVVVLATLCWRGLALRNTFASARYRVDHFAALVQQRLSLLAVPASSTYLHHPLRLFATLFAHATILLLQTSNDTNESQGVIDSLQSACQIASLTQPLAQGGFFTV